MKDRIDTGFEETKENFDSIRKAICKMALNERAEQQNGSRISLIPLSTCAGDDKNVWSEFRQEFWKRGFRGKTLDKHKDLIMAYCMMLEQSGVLDRLQELPKGEGGLLHLKM